VVSTAEVPTGQMVVDHSQGFPAAGAVIAAVQERVRSARFLDAAALAARLFDDEQYANMILVGAAYQAGALPIGAAAIEDAIALNGVAVDANVAAFRQGRLVVSGSVTDGTAGVDEIDEVVGVSGVSRVAGEPERDLAAILAVRLPELTAFQDEACAHSYAAFVERVRAREAEVAGTDLLARTVAENLFKLTAYKDEYEVARLSLDPGLAREIEAEFGPGARYRYQLHPPVLRALGMRRKISLGPWSRPALRTLTGMRRLRGTRLDPFGRSRVRRVEWSLVGEYRDLVTSLLAGLTSDNHGAAVEIAALPDMIRGYEDVKLRNVDAYRERVTALVAGFSAGGAVEAPVRSG
jgi:indolepyruvate ferredoxin oxidoreductase